MERREFLQAALVAGVPITYASRMALAATDPATEGMPQGEMQYRTLGRTGEKVSCIGVGGFHIGVPEDENEGIKIIRTAIDHGVNFMDNCWDYHNGGSEIRMGKALQDGYRDKVFLMTKIDGRTKQAAMTQIEQSLQRLQTDRIDLMQHHEIIRIEDPHRIFNDGAMEACIEARDQGKIRYIGFTGHKDPMIHLSMLEMAKKNNFRFDAVQMPLNVLDAHYRSFREEVLPVLVQEEIGVLGMKPLASGHALRTKTVDAIECLHFAMSLPTSVVITGMEKMDILKQALEAVYSFKQMNEDEMQTLLAKTAEVAADGKYEPFKTSNQYDGTAKNPDWLG